jgi:hypothetical protein
MALVAAAGRAEGPAEVKLPDPVAATFKAQFPKAEIQKLTSEEEEGVVVYDFEFKDGDAEKETDIAADGTMMEWTLVIPAEKIPPAAMKTIDKSAKGAALGRLEHIEVSYTTKAGKVVKLPEMVVRYAAELTKDGKRTEVIVNADGSVFEEPDWAAAVPVPKAPKGH